MPNDLVHVLANEMAVVVEPETETSTETAVIAGLGRDVRTETGTDVDLNANVVVFDDGKSPRGSVQLTRDNLTGERDVHDAQVMSLYAVTAGPSVPCAVRPENAQPMQS
ncbi:hypothetical protein ACFV5G_36200 [Streptomyces sp. NPDC059766]|uniref:hypothetical protein n=1 Tax=Streptomyces sp. NPDC059766 TaxID=3346940 RepID=UPI0036508060